MSDRQLRYFLICAQELSFTRAAERLALSQSALSQQIRELERDLDLPLFIRKGRGVALTPAGVELQYRVEPHLLGLDQVVKEIKFHQGISEGTISIASVHPVLSYLLPDLISDYAKKNPKVSLNLRCGSSQRVIDLTYNRTVDFGIIYNNVVSDMNVEPLFTESLSAVFSPKMPYAKELLDSRCIPKNARLLMFPSSYSTRRVVDNALSIKHQFIQIETETVDSMLNFTQAGAGICFLPEYIFNRYPDLYHCEIINSKMEVPVALITKPDISKPPIVSEIVKNIKKLVDKEKSFNRC